MPHAARKQSESGYYHVVPKGIANQLIFEGDADRQFYQELLAESKEEYDLIVHAYVLMSNHTHLVIEDPWGNLALGMKYLHERYAMYYADKIGRTGGIFRKPYWSEPIETDNHLLCAVRYVHANPAAAGICPASRYEWSSAKDYLGRKGITDTKAVLAMLHGKEGFIKWSQPCNSSVLPFAGSKLKNHLLDEEALVIARDILLGTDPSRILEMTPEDRCQAVEKLVSRGFPVAQLSRLTGISESTVRRLSRRRETSGGLGILP